MILPLIEACAVPDDALLARYLDGKNYVDCFAVDTRCDVSAQQHVAAFYTTWVFKLERLILKLLVSKPSTDAQAQQLAAGMLDEFAAWSVEARAVDQLLMCDYQQRTRSWLMTLPLTAGGTRLYFGSAIVALRSGRTGRVSIGFGFRALLGFHRVYSRVLLYAARVRLEST